MSDGHTRGDRFAPGYLLHAGHSVIMPLMGLSGLAGASWQGTTGGTRTAEPSGPRANNSREAASDNSKERCQTVTTNRGEQRANTAQKATTDSENEQRTNNDEREEASYASSRGRESTGTRNR